MRVDRFWYKSHFIKHCLQNQYYLQFLKITGKNLFMINKYIQDIVIDLYRKGNTQKQIAAITTQPLSLIRTIINGLEFKNTWTNPNPPIQSHIVNQIFILKAERYPPNEQQKLKHQAGIKKYTQAAIAKKLKISPAVVSKILNNKRYADRHRLRSEINVARLEANRQRRISRIARRRADLRVELGPRRRGPIPTPKTAEVFWAQVQEPNGDCCREWKGSINKQGYGRLVWGDSDVAPLKDTYAHRVAAQLSGLIEPFSNEVIYQTCKNKLCCNPEHLKPAPPREKRHIRSSLSIKDAAEVLRRMSINVDGREEIKRDYGVSDLIINEIINNPEQIHKLNRGDKRRAR